MKEQMQWREILISMKGLKLYCQYFSLKYSSAVSFLFSEHSYCTTYKSPFLIEMVPKNHNKKFHSLVELLN